MNTVVWSDCEAARLRQARETARMDIATLSKLACLSMAQLRQLEEGGESCFYTSTIKHQAGQRALACVQHASQRRAA